MIIFGNRKFVQATFDSESELERIVVENAEYLFGPSSIYLPKTLISTHDGVGTIPDGFAIDLAARQWFIVEAELSRHSVWSHIAPQVAKQLIAATTPRTRQVLINVAVDEVRGNDQYMEKFIEQGIDVIDVRRVLDEILQTKPIIGMPIDHVTNDLREWAATLRSIVKLWTVRKLVEFARPESFMYEFPEEHRPTLDTETEELPESQVARYDVSIIDLVEQGLLAVGEVLSMSYKPRNGDRKTYEGTVSSDGSIVVLGKPFGSPSYAALYAMEDAGSTRATVNGWPAWRNTGGKTLAALREEYLESISRSERLHES